MDSATNADSRLRRQIKMVVRDDIAKNFYENGEKRTSKHKSDIFKI